MTRTRPLRRDGRTPSGSPAPDDHDFLRELGYTPVLKRRMGPFANFAGSFSVISVLSGCLTLYGFGLATGGPAVMMWGWIGVGIMVMFVGAGLAEVTSAYPTSGALYFMADRLGGRRWGWYTGWLNLLGLLGAIAGIDYGCALFAGAFARLQWGFEPTPGSLMVIYVCVLALHAVLNLFGVRLVGILNSVSVWWHLAGVALIVGVLWLVPSHHQPVSFVFTAFVNETGWHSTPYVALIGLLLAQYTFSGYDASAHLSEETTGAQVNAARGIVRAIRWSWAAGFVLLAGLTFAIQDYAGVRDTPTGVPPAQIFLDALGVSGAKALLLVVIVAQLFCGNAEVAATSRMVFAFSRDGALPGSARWRRVSPRTGTPTRAVLLSVAVALVLALPLLLGGVRGRDLHQHHRHHPGLRDPRLPAAAPPPQFPPRPVEPGPLGRPGRLGGRRLGGLRDRPLLPPAVRPHLPGHLQLRPRGPVPRPGPGHRLVGRIGPAHVRTPARSPRIPGPAPRRKPDQVLTAPPTDHPLPLVGAAAPG